jgi:hypothetical protein
VSVVDDVRQQITKRLKELKPLVDEYHELEAMVRRLADGDGARSSPAQSPTRRRSTRSTNGRSGGRPRGGGTRSAQALALVQAKPGITIPEMGQEMRITPNYLYRVLPELAKHGKVKRLARGGSPRPSSSPPGGALPCVGLGRLSLDQTCCFALAARSGGDRGRSEPVAGNVGRRCLRRLSKPGRRPAGWRYPRC